MSRRSWFMAMILMRCPRCRDGRIFASWIAVHRQCPKCELLIEREPGYFMGAMYLSYGLAVAILVPLFFVFRALLPGWSDIAVATLSLLPYLPMTILVYRYSRVMWIYIDRSSMSFNGNGEPRDG
jgi:uncharacterized protein (DUF983 family)